MTFVDYSLFLLNSVTVLGISTYCSVTNRPNCSCLEHHFLVFIIVGIDWVSLECPQSLSLMRLLSDGCALRCSLPVCRQDAPPPASQPSGPLCWLLASEDPWAALSQLRVARPLFKKHLFIYLATPGLSCRMQDLVP